MAYDLTSFCDAQNVMYVVEGKNVSSSGEYLGINCPFCGDTGFHGGWRYADAGFTCWRCGYHSTKDLLQMLIPGHPHPYTVLNQYGGVDNQAAVTKLMEHSVKPELKINYDLVALDLPGTTMDWYHRQYLAERGYDADKLEVDYHLLGTTPAYKYGSRIVIPIYYQNSVVSWQTRAIDKRSSLRYITAKPEEERIFHKHLLYNIDKCVGDSVIVVEGVFDVFRLGPNNVCASFGTSFLPEQLLHLKNKRRVFMLFDTDDLRAQQKARTAASMLQSLGVQEVYNVDLGAGQGDPGDLDDDQASYLVKQLLGV